MSGEFRISDDMAILHAPLALAARAQLRAKRPSSLELVGDWSDLGVLWEIASGVKRLAISGDLEQGRINGAAGLKHFTGLLVLHFASEVKKGYDLADLPVLETFEGAWQEEALSAFDHPALRSVFLRGFPHTDLSRFDTMKPSGLSELWLSGSKLETLRGSVHLASLKKLRITDARKLVSLDGLDLPLLEVLDIENASKLSSLEGLAGAPALKALRLLSIAPAVDLHPINRVGGLEKLQVGGRIASDIDWEHLVALYSLKRVFAWWDAASVPEERIRAVSARAAKSVEKFEPVPGKGRRPLLVEWG